MGGYSDEYKVSLKSGQLILDSVDRDLYEVYAYHILSDSWTALADGNSYTIDKGDFGFELNGQKKVPQAIFNIIHGTPGEDGMLQAYWQILGIPFTGCGHYLSALTFNKKDCIAVLQKYGISAAKSVYLSEGQDYQIDKIVEKVGLPCFVKPNQSGSSLGISKVKKAEDLPQAIDVAFQEDQHILIESFLDGTEVSVGVVEWQGEAFVTGITEIVSHNEFFDYEAKYQGASEEITPARLDGATLQKISDTAIHAYRSLGMSGMSRSEYIMVNGEPHFLEMNTLPGFSPASILPQQLSHSGISIPEFINAGIAAILGA